MDNHADPAFPDDWPEDWPLTAENLAVVQALLGEIRGVFADLPPHWRDAPVKISDLFSDEQRWYLRDLSPRDQMTRLDGALLLAAAPRQNLSRIAEIKRKAEPGYTPGGRKPGSGNISNKVPAKSDRDRFARKYKELMQMQGCKKTAAEWINNGEVTNIPAIRFYEKPTDEQLYNLALMFKSWGDEIDLWD